MYSSSLIRPSIVQQQMWWLESRIDRVVCFYRHHRQSRTSNYKYTDKFQQSGVQNY